MIGSILKKSISCLLSMAMVLSVCTAGFTAITAGAETALPSGDKGDGLGISFVDESDDYGIDVDKIALTSTNELSDEYYLKLTNDYRADAQIVSVTITNGLSAEVEGTIPAFETKYFKITGKASSNNTVCEVTIVYTLDNFDNYQEQQYSLTAKGFIYCEYAPASSEIKIAMNYDPVQCHQYTEHDFGVNSPYVWLSQRSVSGGCTTYTGASSPTSSQTGSMAIDVYVNREKISSLSWRDVEFYHRFINRYSNAVTVKQVPVFSSDSNYDISGSFVSGLTTSTGVDGNEGSSTSNCYFTGIIPLGSSTVNKPNTFTSSTVMVLKGSLSFFVNYSEMNVTMTFNVYAYDKSDLRDYVATCEGYCLNSALFSSDKWDIYQDALKQAKTILGKSRVSQYDVAQAKRTLEENFISLQRTCITDEQAEQLRFFTEGYEAMTAADGNVYCHQNDMIEKYGKYYDTAVSYITNQYSTTYENGEYLLTCLDGFEFEEHDFVHQVIEPTCEEKGFTGDVCTKCGEALEGTVTDVKNPLGHDYTLVDTTITCLTRGYNSYRCERCGKEYEEKEENSKASGHSWVLTSSTNGVLTYTCANKNCMLQSDGTYKAATLTTDGKYTNGLSATVVRTKYGYYAPYINCASQDTYFLKLTNTTSSPITLTGIGATGGLSIDFTATTIPAKSSVTFNIYFADIEQMNFNSVITVSYEGGYTQIPVYCTEYEAVDTDAANHTFAVGTNYKLSLKLNDIFNMIYVESVSQKYAQTSTSTTCYPYSEWSVYIDKEDMLFSGDESDSDTQQFGQYTWNNTMLALELTSYQSSNYYTVDPIKLTSSTDGSMNFFLSGEVLTSTSTILNKVPQSETAWIFFDGDLPSDKAVFTNSSSWTVKEYSSSSTYRSFTYLAGNFKINAYVFDKSSLREFVTKIECAGLIASDFTADSWNSYISALSQATEALGKQKTCQSEVDSAYAALQTAYNSLVPIVHATSEQMDAIKSFAALYEDVQASSNSYCNRTQLLTDYSDQYAMACEYIANEICISDQQAQSLIDSVSGFVPVSHTYTATVKPATCTSGGYTTYKCTNCANEYIANYVSKLGHDYIQIVTPPTCTEKGYTSYVCSRGDDSYIDTETYTEALGHSWDEGKVTTLPTCTEDGVKTFTCTVCGETKTETVPALGHDYSPVVTSPTCTESGYTTYVCSRCASSYIDPDSFVDAVGHTWSDGVITTEATCTESGVKTYTCTVCGATKTQSIAALGHNLGAWTANADNLTHSRFCSRDGCTYSETQQCEYITNVTAPTCTADGYTTHICTVCSNVYTDNIVPATGHKFGSWISSGDNKTHYRTCSVCGIKETKNCSFTLDVVPATCTSYGYTVFTCDECGDSYVGDYVTQLGHDYRAVVTPPTCTDKGYTTYICTRCGDSYVDTASYTNALGHSWDDGTITTAPTCTKSGVKTYICTVCAITKTESVESLGHDYQPAVTPPTCTDKGYTTYTCTRCGDSYVDTASYTNALGHSWDDGAITTEATAETDGVKTYTCTVCGVTKTEVIPKLGHEYVAVVTPPTCTEDGYTTFSCTTCYDVYVANIVPALGHDYGAWTESGDRENHYRICSRCGDTQTENCTYTVAVTEPTCTEGGYTTHSCSVCGSVYVDGETSALGHSFGEWISYGNGTHFRVCSTCAIVETGDCEYDTVVTPPTCTAQGSTKYTCSICGDSYIADATKALGHDYVAVVTAPTCTDRGYTTYTCSRCGDSYVDDYVAALGHTYSDWISDGNAATHTRTCSRCGLAETADCNYLAVTTAPTCTQSGYTTHTCSVCGDSYTDNNISALGHSYSAWVSDGNGETHTRTCTRCGLVETVKCSFVAQITKPTCTEMGYTTYTCSDCGYSYVTDYTSALGHDYSEWTSNGNYKTHYRICSRCDNIEASTCTFTTVVTPPTCTQEGYTTYTCSVCHANFIDNEVPATGHAFGKWVPDGNHDTHSRTCSTCSLVETEKCYYSAVVTEPTCTSKGYTTFSCAVCGDEYVGDFTDYAPHDYELISSPPADGIGGYAYYHCKSCSQLFYTDGTAVSEGVSEEQLISNSAVPAPVFNNYTSADNYNYKNRGASLKLDGSGADSQMIRFKSAVSVPEGAVVTDIGYVYTLTRYLNSGTEPSDNSAAYGLSDFVIGSDNVMQFSVAGSQNGKYSIYKTGNTYTYTFNLVIDVLKINWNKHYAARAYIVYEYKGVTHTVYDSTYSSRSIEWVAQAVVDSPTESDETKAYIKSKILG